VLIATQHTNNVALSIIMIVVITCIVWFLMALFKVGAEEDKDREKRWIKMHPIEKDPEDTLVGDHITVWRKKSKQTPKL